MNFNRVLNRIRTGKRHICLNLNYHINFFIVKINQKLLITEKKISFFSFKDIYSFTKAVDMCNY